MDMRDIILDKRYGRRLNADQINYFINGVTNKVIPEYQISALLMAIVLNGMEDREMTELAMSMARSGEICDLSSIKGTKVDKHSTGGVGDKCTPIILPIVASFGIPVVKLSGRGLGFTGGTIDKLESVQGFRTSIPIVDFPDMIRKSGMVLSGQTPELAPADKELYALRDVTGTVDSVPLIASSIMSKKIAGGADAIVLDVTCGDGAFMRDIESARRLSEAMIRIGKIASRPVTCVITSMRQPLGRAIGNVLEMMEVEDFFRGKMPIDLEKVCVTLAASMLMLSDAGTGETLESASRLCREKLSGGMAREAFLRFIEAQGGRVNSDGSLLYSVMPRECGSVLADRDGYVSEVFASAIGKASVRLGAGRNIKSDLIDPGAGILLHKKIGDYASKGEALCTLYSGNSGLIDSARIEDATQQVKSAFVLRDEKESPPPEILEILS